MATAARKLVNAATARRELCEELLLLRKHPTIAAAIDRMDAIKSELKVLAGTEGKFREVFVGVGHVSVSPESPEEVTGEKPVILVAAWTALKQPRREKLIEQGLVKIEPIVKGAYYGRVDVRLVDHA